MLLAPQSPMDLSSAAVTALGEAIDRYGISADPTGLNRLAHEARDRGVDSLLVDVMIDEYEPPVARVRAFARVSSALLRR